MNKQRFRELLTRRAMMTLIILIQICLFIFIVAASGGAWRIVSIIFQLFSVFAALYVINKSDNAPFKLSWVSVILIFPLFGGVFYMWNRLSTRRLSKKLEIIGEKSRRLLPPSSDVLPLVPEEYSAQARYLQEYAGFPVYAGTHTKYLSPGEQFFKSLIEELERAEKYIFMEFFIIQHGKMWSEVLEILTRKAAAGVDVRIIYDDVGCFLRLPKDYPKELSALGIKCKIFNPFRPLLSSVQNNRDHRKIVSIDGHVAYTGGVNLADEYINEIDRFGHWKDCAVKLTGKAAWSLTIIFLELWRLLDKTPDDIDAMRPKYDDGSEYDDGFVQPFADSPMDSEHICANVFLGIINRAKRYIYINTPYLIIDDAMINSFILAAKSGVDVRIVTPHKADKPIIHATTRSYYRQLILAGVRIYEYTNGFMHSKTIIADDEVGVIGTTNFDYRSLYLHFECGALMYGSAALRELRDDFLETLSSCHEVTEERIRKGVIYSVFQSLLRLFSPIM